MKSNNRKPQPAKSRPRGSASKPEKASEAGEKRMQGAEVSSVGPSSGKAENHDTYSVAAIDGRMMHASQGQAAAPTWSPATATPVQESQTLSGVLQPLADSADLKTPPEKARETKTIGGQMDSPYYKRKEEEIPY